MSTLDEIAGRDALDVERLAKALVKATRDAATENRTDLHGRGWPAYSEWRNGRETTVTLIVNDLAERIAEEYVRLTEGSDRT